MPVSIVTTIVPSLIGLHGTHLPACHSAGLCPERGPAVRRLRAWMPPDADPQRTSLRKRQCGPVAPASGPPQQVHLFRQTARGGDGRTEARIPGRAAPSRAPGPGSSAGGAIGAPRVGTGHRASQRLARAAGPPLLLRDPLSGRLSENPRPGQRPALHGDRLSPWFYTVCSSTCSPPSAEWASKPR